MSEPESRASRRSPASAGPPLVVRLGVPALVAGGLLLALSQQSGRTPVPVATQTAGGARGVDVGDGTVRAARGGQAAAPVVAGPPAAPVFRDPRALIQPAAVEAVPAEAAKPQVAAVPAVAPVSANPTAPAVAGPVKAPSPAAAPLAAPAAAPVVEEARPFAAAALPEPPPRPVVAAAAAVSAVSVASSGIAQCPPPDILVTPLAAGRMQVRVASACRKGQEFRLVYGGVELVRRIAVDGRLDLELDLFAGDRRSADVLFADGTRRVIPTLAHDLGRLSKVAVAWKAPVDLDLHAWEPGSDGAVVHVSAEHPSASRTALEAIEAGGRGRGFLGQSDDGRGGGDKLEVYTFLHGTADQLAGGAGAGVRMALDHATRGATPADDACGDGGNARVEFSLLMLSRSGELTRAEGTLAAMPCGRRLEANDRLDTSLLPVLRTRGD